ncbi:MAG: glycosyltransferase [Bacteroidaceae bacterium]|nr:glycosyltransferase [Bacteroidaceae bacterium]
MKRVLFVANSDWFSNFNAPYMAWFKNQGWMVDNASPGIEAGEVDHQYDVCIQRSPYSLKNFTAYRQLKRLIDANDYDLIHCHTPMGSILARLAGRAARRRGTKIIYTAHGFHFYKGAPWLNWAVYFPIERFMSRYTDTLVTINREDYDRARRYAMYEERVFHIDGVGVNLGRFYPRGESERVAYREQLRLGREDFVLLYTAQFAPDKNHRALIRQLPALLEHIPELKVVFAGSGPMMDPAKSLVTQLGLKEQVRFLGRRYDVEMLCAMSDLHVSPSIREGQGLSNIEAMASGLPIVVADNRGHREVCVDGVNGFLFDYKHPEEMVPLITRLYDDTALRRQISRQNVQDAKRFSVDHIVEVMAKIYKETLE